MKIPGLGILYHCKEVCGQGDCEDLQFMPANELMSVLKLPSNQVPHWSKAGEIAHRARKLNYRKITQAAGAIADSDKIIGTVI